MRLFIKRKNGINAFAEYDKASGRFIVLKGSKVSDSVTLSETFRGAKSIEKSREDTVLNDIVIKDVVFKSASTAANFVTGVSTNGLIVWKDENGKNLKDILSGEE